MGYLESLEKILLLSSFRLLAEFSALQLGAKASAFLLAAGQIPLSALGGQSQVFDLIAPSIIAMEYFPHGNPSHALNFSDFLFSYQLDETL